MVTFLVIFGYLLVAYFVWREIYKWLYRNHQKEFASVLEWDSTDRVFGVVWGGVVALLWPGLAVIAVVYFALKFVVSNLAPNFFTKLEK